MIKENATSISPLHMGNPLTGTFTNSEATQCSISSGSKLFVKDKFRQYFYENYNLTPLEMCNGLYQIRRKNPLVYKGLVKDIILLKRKSVIP